MPLFTVAASRRIAAPAATAYALIADYRDGHPRIVPPRAFRDLRVTAGPGTGAGTHIAFEMRVAGRTIHARAIVTEPDPGRVLVESNDGGDHAITTFTVAPIDAASCTVTISTEFDSIRGPLGALRRYLVSRLMRSLYEEELVRLETEAAAG